MIKELWRQIQTQLFEVHLLLIGILPAPLLSGFSFPSCRGQADRDPGRADEPGREEWEKQTPHCWGHKAPVLQGQEKLCINTLLWWLWLPPRGWEGSNFKPNSRQVCCVPPTGSLQCWCQKLWGERCSATASGSTRLFPVDKPANIPASVQENTWSCWALLGKGESSP